MDDSNPYHSPADDDAGSISPDESFDPRLIGKARQVPTVAILMIVHGVCMFLAGLFMIGITVFMVPQIAQQVEVQQRIQREQNPNASQLDPQIMQTMFYAMYGGFAVVLFIIGVVGVIAGWFNYRFRYRVFGVISMVVNIGSVFFCWCLPLSIGLLIYGLIIYLSSDADRAFRWQYENSKRL